MMAPLTALYIMALPNAARPAAADPGAVAGESRAPGAGLVKRLLAAGVPKGVVVGGEAKGAVAMFGVAGRPKVRQH